MILERIAEAQPELTLRPEGAHAMTPKRLIGGLLLAGPLILTPTLGQAQTHTCADYADYVQDVARTRDKGVSHTEASARLWKWSAVVNAPRDFYALQQDAINAVYAEPKVTPRAWYQRAHQACLDFVRVQPPRAPRLR
jgi:hypothetical protein